ncbi:MAG TPA: O-antigen ligase family protein [Patescibacteria group bacterium]|nr:O-antigen ligase family protein [Patescibacteria group bacterium]
MTISSSPIVPLLQTRLAPMRRQSIVYLLIAITFGLLIGLLPLKSAVTLILGIGLFLLALIQPLIAMALVLLAGPLGAVENFRLGGVLFTSSQLLFLLTVCLWIAYGIIRRRIYIPSTPINLILILFFTVAAVSLINAPSLRIGLKEEIKWIEMTLALLLVTDLAMNWRAIQHQGRSDLSIREPGMDTRWVLAILLIAGMSQAMIGIWQFGLRGDGPDHFLILDRFYRAFGTFQQPNPFGGFMGITAALAVGTLIGTGISLFFDLQRGKRWKAGEWLWLVFLIFASITTGVALIMSWSRGAWLGFASGLVVLIFFLPKKRWKGVLLIVLGLMAAILMVRLDLVPGAISDRLVTISEDFKVGDVRGELVTIENFAVIERLAHWQAGIDMARNNLLLGVGFGNYEVAYEEYGLLNWTHPLGHAHNYYINILAETGVVGVITYLLLWVTIFIQAFWLLKKIDWPDRGIVLGLLTAWTALAVHHFFDKLYVNNLYLFVGVMLALQQIIYLKHDRTIR